MNSHCGQEVTKMRAQVSMISHIFEAQYGRKYITKMKESKNFTRKQINAAKRRLKQSGNYSRDKIDDVTDFLGLTECSSEDDVTAKDLCRGLGDCVREGPVDHAEFVRRNNANRTESEKLKIQESMREDAEAEAQAAPGSSRRTCF